ncbi:LysR family transcriptional regulator [Gluconobacter wancherniae]|uniref:LysR family transcriptional regulator n=1 Tax=Gluconobacter wancherniae TaxID=1307955 RepID=UPI001B8B3763|nr:LysR family transcriptional regulator [Gluconobacter wancherniae]MBS1063665.1 LysR family transcriptional regulator [Gluconobacter wancherniae]
MAVADHASFIGASRKLALSPTTVTRTIKNLEAVLGVSLFSRTTRSVRLTTEGADFLARCRAAIVDLDDAITVAQGAATVPRGELSITAPVVFGRLHILPVITELLKAWPQLNIRLFLTDRVVHLVEEGIDLAIRIAPPQDSALKMQKIGEVQKIFVASPAYLKKHGEPQVFEDLATHSLIEVNEYAAGYSEWRQGGKSGFSIRVSPRLFVNSVDAALTAAIEDLGIVTALSYQTHQFVENGQLRRILTDTPVSVLPVFILFPVKERQSVNVRTFVSAMKDRFMTKRYLKAYPT